MRNLLPLPAYRASPAYRAYQAFPFPAVRAGSYTGPFPVAEGLETPFPDFVKIVRIDVPLAEKVAVDIGAGTNTAVDEDGGDVDPGAAEKAKVPHFFLIPAEVSFATERDFHPPSFLTAAFDEFHQAGKFFVGKAHVRIGGGTAEIAVEARVPVGIPMLLGDAGQLTQAAYNLIKNAIQAMSEGGRLTIDVEADDVHVHVRFADTGPGIDEVALQRLMEPYFTTKSSGTGLGLLIVDRIVRAHGGELTIESRPGEGAAFTISLPRHARMVRQLEAGQPVGKE